MHGLCTQSLEDLLRTLWPELSNLTRRSDLFRSQASWLQAAEAPYNLVNSGRKAMMKRSHSIMARIPRSKVLLSPFLRTQRRQREP